MSMGNTGTNDSDQPEEGGGIETPAGPANAAPQPAEPPDSIDAGTTSDAASEASIGTASAESEVAPEPEPAPASPAPSPASDAAPEAEQAGPAPTPTAPDADPAPDGPTPAPATTEPETDKAEAAPEPTPASVAPQPEPQVASEPADTQPPTTSPEPSPLADNSAAAGAAPADPPSIDATASAPTPPAAGADVPTSEAAATPAPGPAPTPATDAAGSAPTSPSPAPSIGDTAQAPAPASASSEAQATEPATDGAAAPPMVGDTAPPKAPASGPAAATPTPPPTPGADTDGAGATPAAPVAAAAAPSIGDTAAPGSAPSGPPPGTDGAATPAKAGPVEDPDFPGGTIVTGPVLEVTADELVVDLGGGRQGVVSRRHYDEQPPPTLVGLANVGDMVLGAVLIRDDPKGRVVLSRSWAVRKSAMDAMAKAHAEKATIDAEVVKVVKGGLVLDVGVRGFLPRSLATLDPKEKLADLVGQTVTVRVLELDQEKNRVVLDRKTVLRKERSSQKAEILSSLKKNEVRSGVVRSIADFGVFVDIGGAEGLVHLSELSWTRVENPKTFVKVGETVQVKILEIRKSKGRIRLSMRATTPDPIHNANVGEVVEGTVTRLADFGAFVDIGGTEGLVHINQLSEHRVFTPDEVVIPGDRVFVKVIGVDRKRRRVDLSITQAVQSVSAPPVDPNAKVSEEAPPVAEPSPPPEPPKAEAEPTPAEPTSEEPQPEPEGAKAETKPETEATPSEAEQTEPEATPAGSDAEAEATAEAKEAEQSEAEAAPTPPEPEANTEPEPAQAEAEAAASAEQPTEEPAQAEAQPTPEESAPQESPEAKD